MYRVILLAKDRRIIRELSTITGMTKVDWEEGELFNIRNIYIPLFTTWTKSAPPPRLGYIFSVLCSHLLLHSGAAGNACGERQILCQTLPYVAQNVHVHHTSLNLTTLPVDQSSDLSHVDWTHTWVRIIVLNMSTF